MSIKLIKPLRLSVLYRPYRWHAENHLCVSVMALADLSQPTEPKLLGDSALWRDCMPDMDNEGVLDLVWPKAVPEYLVAARAYTHHQDDKQQVAVKARVGELEKELLVFGDRYWLDETHASAPQAFDEIPVAWHNTFGGPSFAANPQGKGMEPQALAHGDYVPLPNVEGLTQRVTRRSQAGQPHSFGPVNVLWPQRYQHVGTYSDEWKQRDFPGFFPDLNPLLFNAAPPEQHWSERDAVPLGQSFAFWNMHPTKACWQGTLPSWQVRCFIEREQQGNTVVEEMAMRASTAWFVPHQERVLLIYHGSIPVSEHDASDIKKLMPALEVEGESTHDAAYYQQLMQRRSDPQQGGLLAATDEQLIPLAVHGPLGLDIPDVFRSAMWVKSRNRIQHLQAELGAELAQQGINPDEYPLELIGPPKPGSDEDFSDAGWQPKSIEEEQQAMLDRIDESYRDDVNAMDVTEEQKQKLLDETPSRFLAEAAQNPQSAIKGPPISLLAQLQSAQAMQAGLQQGRLDVAHLDVLNPGWEIDAEHRAKVAQGQLPEEVGSVDVDGPFERMQDPEFLTQMQRLDALQRDMYLLSVQTQTAVDPLDEERSAALRQALLAKQAQGESLHELDLTGALLSGLELADADLRGVWLEGADLRHARFNRCVFDEGVLARAQLERAQFIDCRFERSNLSLAMLQHARFERCVFQQTVMEQTHIQDSVFVECDFSELQLEQLQLHSCIWQGGRFSLSMFDAMRFEACRFERSVFDKVSVQSCVWQDTQFDQAELTACGFFMSELNQVLFDQAILKNVAIHYQSQMQSVVFSQSELSQCFFREMDLRAVDFAGSRLPMCDFSLCQMQGTVLQQVDANHANFSGSMLQTADFTQAQLIEADFTGADLRLANFKQANLFRANLGLCYLDDTTVLHGAYIEEANVYPLRDAEAAQHG